MSGHNPHSHLSQPNSSWNPLQIPSYIPRQPQLAHMSNERPVVRSPLTWHSPAPPTPPEAFYSFLSNHKNLELNPLLPSFVRGPSPFGSVDLTIQSARNSTTASQRNLASSPPLPQEFPGHNKLQQPPFPPQLHQQHHQHPQIARSLTPNNSNSSNILPPSGPGVIQSTGSVRDKFHGGTSSSNNNGDITMPQMPHPAASIFVRDARQINNEIAKIAARDCVAKEASMLSTNEPVELTKEHPYQPIKAHTAVPTSPKRLSPTRPPSIPNCTPLSPRARSPLTSTTNTGSATDIVNNHNVKTTGNGCTLPPVPKPETVPTAVISLENSPLSLTLPSSPTPTTSNEDSVDSQTSKSRRKRKPNKTTRVSNDSDESMHERMESDTILPKLAIMPTEASHGGLVPDKSETLIDLDSNKVISSNKEPDEVVNVNVLACQSDNQTQDGSRESSNNTAVDTHDVRTPDEVDTARTNEPAERHNAVGINGESPPTPMEASCAEQIRPHRPASPANEPPSVIVNNTSMNAVNRNGSNSPILLNRSNTKILNNCHDSEPSPTSPVPDTNPEPIIESQTSIDKLNPPPSSPSPPIAPKQDPLDSPQKRSKRKGDSDDIETIDKIAAMIASSQGGDDETSVNINSVEDAESNAVLSEQTDMVKQKGGAEETETKAQIDETQLPSNNSKISDLAEMLETPPEGSSPNKDLSEDSAAKGSEKIPTKEIVENCFEEVENKLEEMFAGIEDGEPPPCILPTPAIDDPITPEVICELGLGGVFSPLKQKPSATSSEETNHRNSHHSKDESSSSKSSNHHNSNQKRSHNNCKSDNSPPKKKRKMSKKSSQSSSGTNQKASSSSSSSSKPAKPNSSAESSHGGKPTKSNDKQKPSTSKDKIKDDPMTVEYKGPFIQVKTDGTINVINAPTAEDVVEKQNKVKKSIHNHSHGDRSKIRGLHVSTLSTKYDADTTDTTWMCVFCKKGPHKLGLGDLFGPYIITTTCEGFAYSQKDPNDDDFISRRTKADMVQRQINGMPVVPASTSSLALATAAALNTSSSSSTISKKKRKTNGSPSLHQSTTSSCSTPLLAALDTDDIFMGMTKVSDTSYEVWVHENCVVWSSGVYIIGARILDLDTAVWSSTRYMCSVCSKNGAMISCLQRGCNEKAHIPCARMQSWTLDENEFKCTCGNHCLASLTES